MFLDVAQKPFKLRHNFETPQFWEERKTAFFTNTVLSVLLCAYIYFYGFKTRF